MTLLFLQIKTWIIFNNWYYSYFADGIKDVIVAIAHRGRLNLLTLLMKFPPVEMFRKVRANHFLTNNNFQADCTLKLYMALHYCWNFVL